MNKYLRLALLALSCLISTSALGQQDNAENQASAPAVPASVDPEVLKEIPLLPDYIRNFCVIGGIPPDGTQYVRVRPVRAKKGTYGSVLDLLPSLVKEAYYKDKADAIIEFSGSQRYGVFIWRLVRPVATGVSIKWTGEKPLNCEQLGGMTFAQMMQTNTAPSKTITSNQ
ncbi:MAG TPA: hypothetical protein PLW86_18365 [Rhodocyclaceae bacterium]|nr:hypothetical protein [Rhodocyclaceae bacterium]